eukprot:NODE_348_length_10403_cov_0.608210.p4 type:complete len:259 gc:universal NODE_348_length_10403_cov_0.608210:7324-6548(-)
MQVSSSSQMDIDSTISLADDTLSKQDSLIDTYHEHKRELNGIKDSSIFDSPKPNTLPHIHELLGNITEDTTLTNTSTSSVTVSDRENKGFLGQIGNLIITTTTGGAIVLSDQIKYTIHYLLDWVNYAIHKMTIHIQYLTTTLQQYHHQNAVVGFNYALQEIKSDFIRLLRMMVDLLNQYGGIVPYKDMLREQVMHLVNVWKQPAQHAEGDQVQQECMDLMNKGNGMISHLDQVRELLQSSVDKAQGVLNWTKGKMKWE